jgi:hypothetical protein
MKEKRTTKQTLILIGKIGAIVSLVLLVFAAIGTAGGFLGLIFFPFVDWSWLRELMVKGASESGMALSWDVGILNATNAEIVSLNVFLSAGTSVGLLYFARGLFANIEKEGTPFTEPNVKLLVNIGIVSLVQAFAAPIILNIVINATGTETLFADSGASGVSLILALFVFALSLVFKYGVELQKEADTTL